jgi:hypothetical protein
MQIRIAQVAAALLVGILVSGCGGGGREAPANLAPVSGKVLIDGTPTANVAVSFIPTGETKGEGAYGASDAEGKYTLTHPSGAAGVEPGKYRVVLSKYVMPDGSPIPEGQSAADVGANESISPAYSDPDSSTLSVDVPADGNTGLDLKISAK